MTINTNKLVVTQANGLAQGIQKMSLQEKRLLLLVMAFVRKDDDDFKLYELPISQVGQYLNLNTKDLYIRLKKIADKLLSRVVEIKREDGGWAKFQWVSRAEYVPASEYDVAKLKLRLHPDLKSKLLKLTECFGSMPFVEVASMKRYTSIRILEILYFQSRKTNHVIEFKLEEFKRILGLEHEYPQFYDFEKRVLIPAKKECVHLTCLRFTYRVKKTGRKVVGLIFQVEQKKKQLSQDNDITQKLRQAGFTGNSAKLLEEHGGQAILDAITLAKRRQSESLNTGNPIRNLGGLIVKILADGAYHIIEEERAEAKTSQEKAIAAQQQAEQANIKAKQQINAIDNKWLKLTDSEKTSVHDWIKQQTHKTILKVIESSNWQGQMYRAERTRALEALGYI